MSGYVPVYPHLRLVWERLSPAAREARYEEAMDRKEVLERFEMLSS